MFHLQIQLPIGPAERRQVWRTIVKYEKLEDASPACERACLSEKCSSRVVEGPADMMLAFPLTPILPHQIVIERFYNPRLDPDENWRDEYKEEEFDLRWQEYGF